ncbi:fused MFS/spermidine synthase [Hydrogenophaga sp. NFH-34]|uniref:fused MFS/spermidine synthase n=1 Tax=Hydrogenophaga sp. NFH-34 TaxID=2744446 RepID=UPI001F2E7292|nr:fused MFS/spermidine synthase [Hydrogenophaga sp. NFH-34]
MTTSNHSAIAAAARRAGLTQQGARVEHVSFRRKLRFGSTDIQSAMDLRDPDRLVLDYTRLMMAFLLFQPQPQHILMIGLGGGSLPKFCHRHLPGSDITVVEIDPAVIALREQFEIPPDQADFRVVQADGADFVAAVDDQRFNVILVDGFDAEQMAPALGTQNFYGHCARLLRPGGVMLCNLHELDIYYGVFMERIALAFDGNALVVGTRECGNAIVFARKDWAIDARLPKHLVRPASMAPSAWSDIEADMYDVLREARQAWENR